MKVDELPLLLIAIEHDGPGPPLAKQTKKTKYKPKAQSVLRKSLQASDAKRVIG